MLKKFFWVVSLLISVNIPTFAYDGLSSYPYISGDTFRDFADYIVDEFENNLVPSQVKPGDVIFVKTDSKGYFFTELHPLIANPYILITHNGDTSNQIPFINYLDDPKLIVWFATNIEGVQHPKLRPLPIGLANRNYAHGSIETLKEVQKQTKSNPKTIMLYLNFNPATYPPERPYVHQLFATKPFCTTRNATDFRCYLFDLSQSKFVLSPRGNGLDCHRTWEALYMKSIPIVKSSLIDPLFDDLPVLVIHDWNEVTEESLKSNWKKIRKNKKSYNLKKLSAQYWFDQISSYKPKNK